ncbi:hypothetical protein AeNC1_004047 [Aphanomyces euteiches]|nr:hypothetical protein AeNC1_004047 [Aphanomyces euteiches]
MTETEKGYEIPPEHAWLLTDDLVFSRHILGRCCGVSDDVSPTSADHIKFARKADTLTKTLKSTFNLPGQRRSSDADEGILRPLQDYVDLVLDLLKEGWNLKPTKLLEWTIGDILDQILDILLTRVTFGNLNVLETFCQSLDELDAANPMKHSSDKLQKYSTHLKKFKEDLNTDHAKGFVQWKPIDDIQADHAAQLSEEISAYFEENRITKEDETRRKMIVRTLEQAIKKKKEWRHCDIRLYGSSLSTMGTKGCDMDLCLTWRNSEYNFKSNSATINEARRAREQAEQNCSERHRILVHIDQARQDLKKCEVSLNTLLEAKKAFDPAQKLPSKKKAAIQRAEYFLSAQTVLLAYLEHLLNTLPESTDIDETDLRNASNHLKNLLDREKERVNKLYKLTAILQKAGCKIVNVIAGARVPIIKFLHIESGLECDICMENTLATKNTLLLRTYGSYDSRVSPLVLAIKKWAKARDVNDASQNTLSSYSYALLLIHFLQILGILPNLQDPQLLEELKVAPELLGGHDVTFCSDVNACRANVGHIDTTHLSIGHIFRLFFDYMVKFPWLTYVVSIRNQKRTKLDRWQESAKSWRMSIEDPFETNRDLGIVLTHLGQEKILKEFERAAEALAKGASYQDIIKSDEKKKSKGRQEKPKPKTSNEDKKNSGSEKTGNSEKSKSSRKNGSNRKHTADQSEVKDDVQTSSQSTTAELKHKEVSDSTHRERSFGSNKTKQPNSADEESYANRRTKTTNKSSKKQDRKTVPSNVSQRSETSEMQKASDDSKLSHEVGDDHKRPSEEKRPPPAPLELKPTISDSKIENDRTTVNSGDHLEISTTEEPLLASKSRKTKGKKPTKGSSKQFGKNHDVDGEHATHLHVEKNAHDHGDIAKQNGDLADVTASNHQYSSRQAQQPKKFKYRPRKQGKAEAPIETT